MRFSRHFGLSETQVELDFVDVELTRDTPLFLDPYAIQIRPDHWAAECAQVIRLFFQSLIDAIRQDDDETALQLLSALHEPKETRLGLSRGHYSGNAIGQHLSRDILEALKGSRAVRTGVLRDLADAELFIPNIGHDRISDLTTNLLRRYLIEYTQQQCRLCGIPVQSVPSGALWDVDTSTWIEDYVDLPVAGRQQILLVPKLAVRWTTLLTSAEYYDDFVIEFLRGRELVHPSLGLVKVLKSGERRVTKKSIKERFPFSKDFLLDFSQHNPEVLEEYKRAKSLQGNVTNAGLDQEFDDAAFANVLIGRLGHIRPGRESATQYHRFMKGALEFIFYPALTHPNVEDEIDDGRKRIDITFMNADREGFFWRFPNITRRTAALIIVECKNYSRDVENPEVDQIAGRFADHRGWLGLLICRRNDDPQDLIARCRDAARNRREYIVPLDDSDITAMLRLIAAGHRNQVGGHLDLIFRQLTL